MRVYTALKAALPFTDVPSVLNKALVDIAEDELVGVSPLTLYMVFISLVTAATSAGYNWYMLNQKERAVNKEKAIASLMRVALIIQMAKLPDTSAEKLRDEIYTWLSTLTPEEQEQWVKDAKEGTGIFVIPEYLPEKERRLINKFLEEARTLLS